MKSANTFFQYHSPWWKRSWDKFLLLFLLFVLFLWYPGQNIYTSLFRENQKEVPKPMSLFSSIPTPTVAPYPVKEKNIDIGNDISASGVVILDVDSGVNLYKRNETMSLSPASTTKIMTALVALDAYKLDDVVTIGTPLQNGQTIGLVSGERITVESLLYAALIHSGNDAAKALADAYPGGYDKFVEAMNTKASGYQLTGTHFTNPMGYDAEDHKMTPMDLARLSVISLKNPVIAKMVAIPQITISDVTHTYYHKLNNVNQLLGKIPGVAGIKTGWTEAAGENLVTYVERNGHRVIFVVLHSRDRFGDTTKLIDWVFTNFTWKEYGSVAK